MIVVVKDGVATCTCNGEVLEAAFKLPETGPIGLEGDRGQMEYRRIRIQSSNLSRTIAAAPPLAELENGRHGLAFGKLDQSGPRNEIPGDRSPRSPAASCRR